MKVLIMNNLNFLLTSRDATMSKGRPVTSVTEALKLYRQAPGSGRSYLPLWYTTYIYIAGPSAFSS